MLSFPSFLFLCRARLSSFESGAKKDKMEVRRAQANPLQGAEDGRAARKTRPLLPPAGDAGIGVVRKMGETIVRYIGRECGIGARRRYLGVASIVLVWLLWVLPYCHGPLQLELSYVDCGTDGGQWLKWSPR